MGRPWKTPLLPNLSMLEHTTRGSFSVNEAAEILGVSRRTVYNYLTRGWIQAKTLGTGSVGSRILRGDKQHGLTRLAIRISQLRAQGRTAPGLLAELRPNYSRPKTERRRGVVNGVGTPTAKKYQQQDSQQDQDQRPKPQQPQPESQTAELSGPTVSQN